MSEQNGYWSRVRTAAEIERLKAITDDPGDTMSLKSRLARKARYITRRVVGIVRLFWQGGGPPTAMAGGL